MIYSFQKFFEGKSKFPNIQEVKIGDFKVLIGKDSESNDYLTTKMANENDIWMHAKGVPGSHVIIRVKENLPTLELIKEVGELAIKNSKYKTEGTVIYCKAKFVKKKKEMKPGQVSVDYKNAYEIKIKI
jgi:predicted ribosome quality control (RQC) complex YloA/Tae2 family protein